jgi:hypothetical protein
LVRLENVIWKAIFDIACGAINVYDAAQLIAQAIPDILEDSRDDDGSWFSLGIFFFFVSEFYLSIILDNPNHNTMAHLSSFDIVEASVPQNWPMADLLAPKSQMPPGDSSMTDQIDRHSMEEELPPGSIDAEQSAQSEAISNNVNREESMEVDEDNRDSAEAQQILRRSSRNIKRSRVDLDIQPANKSKPRKTKLAASAHKKMKTIEETQTHPRVIGSKYMQFSFIDLTQIEVSGNSILLKQRSHLIQPFHQATVPYAGYKSHSHCRPQTVMHELHLNFD